MSDKIGLSKSTFCTAFQCPRKLWLQRNKPELEIPNMNEAVMLNGTRVGECARGYFGVYSLVEYSKDKVQMVTQTEELMASGTETIAEASFIYDNLYCAVDLLHKNGDGWDILEVKSSTSVDDIYVEDVSFQYYVLKNCGINVKRAYLLYINNKYVRHGDLDLQELFSKEDLTDEAKSRFTKLSSVIDEIRTKVGVDAEPDQEIDLCCIPPDECSFMGHCLCDLPTPSIMDIAGLTKKEKLKLYRQGIISFKDLADNGIVLTEKKQLQVDWELEDRPDHINTENIREFLNKLRYPIYHLDFETFQQAVPEFEGGVPYAQIPFQYSLHIEYEDGTLDHKEFLAKEGTDPRRAIAERLCEDIPLDVCSLAYNFGFEKGRLAELAGLYPDLSDHLLNIRDNMIDLMTPFQKGDYYTKAMQGSYSIKYVLPALFPGDPELDYHNLDQVHNGGEAQAAFVNMASMSPEEIKKLRNNLLKYCCLDTYAMVKVLSKLRETVI